MWCISRKTIHALVELLGKYMLPLVLSASGDGRSAGSFGEVNQRPDDDTNENETAPPRFLWWWRRCSGEGLLWVGVFLRGHKARASMNDEPHTHHKHHAWNSAITIRILVATNSRLATARLGAVYGRWQGNLSQNETIVSRLRLFREVTGLRFASRLITNTISNNIDIDI